jgi:hypothetical protein
MSLDQRVEEVIDPLRGGGGDTVNQLTLEQRAIATFWSDGPGITATPPGYSVSIATQVLRAERASLITAAVTYLSWGSRLVTRSLRAERQVRYNLLRRLSRSVDRPPELRPNGVPSP